MGALGFQVNWNWFRGQVGGRLSRILLCAPGRLEWTLYQEGQSGCVLGSSPNTDTRWWSPDHWKQRSCCVWTRWPNNTSLKLNERVGDLIHFAHTFLCSYTLSLDFIPSGIKSLKKCWIKLALSCRSPEKLRKMKLRQPGTIISGSS